MKNDIPPDIQEFLQSIPNSTTHLNANPEVKDSQNNTIVLTKEDKTRIKTMLNNSNDPQAQIDRIALMEYILNFDSEDQIEINDTDRKSMAEYLKKHAPEFYKLIDDS